ncbi:MAG: response regulator transcription factor [Alphaproteobacteria bacterium]|nr:response regulator transcription factor [Alphaproteobacteria bacterium]
MTGIVHIVDDDEAIRDALAWLLRSRGVGSAAYASAEEFLAVYGPETAGCLLLDIRMDGMSGLQLFERLDALGCRMPTIFLTGHGDVPMAVAALKKGAWDFFEKPFNDNQLVDRVIEALNHAERRRAEQARNSGLTGRLASLTPRERQIMTLVLAGRLNKVIADDLGITMRTVEVHRARVFGKMGVKTAVELAFLLGQAPAEA